MIRQKSPAAQAVINVLRQLPQIPIQEGDLYPTEELSAEEITEVTRYLNANNQGLARLIKRLRSYFPRDMKFDIRMVLLTMAYVIANSQNGQEQPRKLH